MSKPRVESIEFANAIFSAGTYASVECGFCKRVHFCDKDTGGEWSEHEAEYKVLESKSDKYPDLFIRCDYTIRFGWMDGKQAVEGCPCGKLKEYEDWIWNRKDMILEYLTARYKKEKAEHDSLGKAINTVIEIKDK